MAGKSTYLRQNALIVALAQMGAFVPARRAHIGVVDRLFSRVGAADDLARGRSTFMVEMVETAAILNQASLRSLVILDEIGRGTATFDGLSIAFACVEHLNAVNRSRTLFATHFHELTRLSRDAAAAVQPHDAGQRMERCAGVPARGRAGRGRPFLRHPGRQARGAAAGRDQPRATMLAELEATNRSGAALRSIDELPLFALAAKPPPPPPRKDELREALASIDPDELTPREAQAALYALKKLATEKPA